MATLEREIDKLFELPLRPIHVEAKRARPAIEARGRRRGGRAGPGDRQAERARLDDQPARAAAKGVRQDPPRRRHEAAEGARACARRRPLRRAPRRTDRRASSGARADPARREDPDERRASGQSRDPRAHQHDARSSRGDRARAKRLESGAADERGRDDRLRRAGWNRRARAGKAGARRDEYAERRQQKADAERRRKLQKTARELEEQAQAAEREAEGAEEIAAKARRAAEKKRRAADVAASELAELEEQARS